MYSCYLYVVLVATGFWQSATEGKALFDPVRALIGQPKTDENAVDDDPSELQSSPRPLEVGEASEKQDSSKLQSDLNKKEDVETEKSVSSSPKEPTGGKYVEVPTEKDGERPDVQKESQGEAESESPVTPIEVLGSSVHNYEVSDSSVEANHESPRMSIESPEPTTETSDSVHNLQQKEFSEMEASKHPEIDINSGATDISQDEGSIKLSVESQSSFDGHSRSMEPVSVADRLNEPMVEGESTDKLETEEKEALKTIPHIESESFNDNQGEGGSETSSVHSGSTEVKEGAHEVSGSELSNAPLFDEASHRISSSDSHESDNSIKANETEQHPKDNEKETKDRDLSSEANISIHLDSMHELERVKGEMKMMETALQGAARQAQVLHVAKHYLKPCR